MRAAAVTHLVLNDAGTFLIGEDKEVLNTSLHIKAKLETDKSPASRRQYILLDIYHEILKTYAEFARSLPADGFLFFENSMFIC